MNPIEVESDALNKEQAEWFDERMSESYTGRVIVPTHLCNKFRRITERPDLDNHTIKRWLIDNIWNRY